MKVSDVMAPDVEVVNPDDTLKTAAQLMADLDSGALPVGENDLLIGVITDHDITVRAVAKAGIRRRPRCVKRCLLTCSTVSETKMSPTYQRRWANSGAYPW